MLGPLWGESKRPHLSPPLPMPQHATPWDATRRLSMRNDLEVVAEIGAVEVSQAEGRRFESGIPLEKRLVPDRLASSQLRIGGESETPP